MRFGTSLLQCPLSADGNNNDPYKRLGQEGSSFNRLNRSKSLSRRWIPKSSSLLSPPPSCRLLNELISDHSPSFPSKLLPFPVVDVRLSLSYLRRRHVTPSDSILALALALGPLRRPPAPFTLAAVGIRVAFITGTIQLSGAFFWMLGALNLSTPEKNVHRLCN